MKATEVIAAYEASGRYFRAAGIESFVLDRGHGEPVVCLHGVPTSAFLYRKLVDELAERGFRGVAFDLPGLGLAGRPADFDYSWTGLGRFAGAAVASLGLERFHLVVHDIGGPVGLELAAAEPGRIKSVTVLNAPIMVDTFKRPWAMEPFAHRVIGEGYLRILNKPMFRWLMRRQGISDPSKVAPAELDAYLALLRRDDHGRAFLKIMKGFELTRAKRELYQNALRTDRYPVQIVWGSLDPALRIDVHGEQARIAAGLDQIHRIAGKHFFPEDHAAELADAVVAFIDPR